MAYYLNGKKRRIAYYNGNPILIKTAYLTESGETLTAPTISLDGSTLTITATDERTETFAIFVDGVEMATVEAVTPTEGLSYELSSDGTYYTCKGIGTVTDTDIVIARNINGIPVKEIGYHAFENCRRLTSIVIPNSVTSIDESAFENCESLTSIVIPDGVTIISHRLFSECYKLTSVVIPDSVTSIGRYAFQYCTSLTSIEIPDSVTSIDAYTFSSCSRLTSIEIPEGVTRIDNYAFHSCSSLTSIEIPDSVTEIGLYAFQYCTSLTSVYYKGTASEWDEISIAAYNTPLYTATRYYYSETQPTTSGKYWHYDENGEIAVW